MMIDPARELPGVPEVPAEKEKGLGENQGSEVKSIMETMRKRKLWVPHFLAVPSEDVS